MKKVWLSSLCFLFVATTLSAQTTTLEVVGVDHARDTFKGVVVIAPHPEGGLAVAFASGGEAPLALGGKTASGWDGSGGLVCDLRPTQGAIGALERAPQPAPTRLVLVRDPRTGVRSGKLIGTGRVAWFSEVGEAPAAGLPVRRGYVLVTVRTGLRQPRDRRMMLPMQISLPRGGVTLYSIYGRPLGTVDLEAYRRAGRIVRGLCYRQEMRDRLHNNRIDEENYLCQVSLGPRPEPAKHYVLAEIIEPTAGGLVRKQPYGELEVTSAGVSFKVTRDTAIHTRQGDQGDAVQVSSIARAGSRYRYVPGRELLRQRDGKTLVFVELVSW